MKERAFNWPTSFLCGESFFVQTTSQALVQGTAHTLILDQLPTPSSTELVQVGAWGEQASDGTEYAF